MKYIFTKSNVQTYHIFIGLTRICSKCPECTGRLVWIFTCDRPKVVCRIRRSPVRCAENFCGEKLKTKNQRKLNNKDKFEHFSS